MLSDLFILAPVVMVFIILVALSWRQDPVPAPSDDGRVDDTPPENAIVVDGSNVMFWGGEPSLKTLASVLRDVESKGYAPIVFFDASVGYKVGTRYYSEETLAPMIGVTFEHICVVSKGVIADESILMFASDHNLRVITDDRFRDWRVKFPHAARKGTLVRGTWANGNVKWTTPLKRFG